MLVVVIHRYSMRSRLYALCTTLLLRRTQLTLVVRGYRDEQCSRRDDEGVLAWPDPLTGEGEASCASC